MLGFGDGLLQINWQLGLRVQYFVEFGRDEIEVYDCDHGVVLYLVEYFHPGASFGGLFLVESEFVLGFFVFALVGAFDL